MRRWTIAIVNRHVWNTNMGVRPYTIYIHSVCVFATSYLFSCAYICLYTFPFVFWLLGSTKLKGKNGGMLAIHVTLSDDLDFDFSRCLCIFFRTCSYSQCCFSLYKRSQLPPWTGCYGWLASRRYTDGAVENIWSVWTRDRVRMSCTDFIQFTHRSCSKYRIICFPSYCTRSVHALAQMIERVGRFREWYC